MNNIRVRFAPSPTGYLHIGGARTALYNYIFAKQNNGKFILRIEDTDALRSSEEFTSNILNSLKWLGIEWDEGPDISGPYGPYKQSERLELYKYYANKLLEENKAYRCFCTPEEIEVKREEAKNKKIPYRYDGKCRNLSESEIAQKLKNNEKFAIRIKNDLNEIITFNDIVRGEISFDSRNFDDFIILRSDEFPVYNFAVVIDDALMKINYVIRGDDHISNTPKQIIIYKILNFPVPNFAHLPMILGEDKTRLSKRHGATSVEQFKELGFLPEAMVNYLVRLGWGYDDTQEIFTKEEIIKNFSLQRVNKSPAVFSYHKLEWINSIYLKNMELNKKTEMVIPFLIKEKLIDKDYADKNFSKIKKIVEVIGARLKTLKDITFYSDFFFKEEIQFDQKIIEEFFLNKNYNVIQLYSAIIENLQLCDKWEKDFIINKFEEVYKSFNFIPRKTYYQLIRVALTGRTISPDLIDIMLILGKEKTIDKIKYCIKFIKDSLQI